MVHKLVNICTKLEEGVIVQYLFYGLRGRQIQRPPRAAHTLATPLDDPPNPRNRHCRGWTSPPWILKFDIFLLKFCQKSCSLSLEWLKWNFTNFGAPPEKSS